MAFSTYNKSFLDTKLAARVSAAISADNKLTVTLFPLQEDGASIHTSTAITLPAKVSDVTYNDTTKQITVTYADGTDTATYTLKNLFTASFAKVENQTGKINLTLTNAGSASSEVILNSTIEKVVFEDEVQTLTYKTIDADSNTISNLETDNLKSGVLQTEVRAAASASDTALASEKAIRTELDKAVHDVQVAGTSVVTDHVASIVKATASDLGVVKVDDSTIAVDADGKISVKDIYTIAQASTTTSGALKTYQLYKNGTEVSGSIIDIPKDFLVKSAEVKVCEENDNPVEGYVVGDKYIDFTINTKETTSGTATNEHIYLLVKDLVAAYNAGDGLNLDNQNRFNVELTASGSGLELYGSTVGDKTLQIAASGVVTSMIADSAVTVAKLADANVTDAKLVDGAVKTAKLDADAVTNAKLADDAVQTENIVNLNVTDAKLAANAVTTAKIADANVTVAKLETNLQTGLCIVSQENDVITFTPLA